MKNLSKVLSLVMLVDYVFSSAALAQGDEVVWDGSVDVSWYSDELGAFEISTPEELAGLAQLVNGGNTFQNKKISLAGDIKLNDGEILSESGEYSFVGETTPNEWTPIGTYTASSSRGFRGTFEGNNHVIEGLYINGDETDYQGLFGISYGCTISGVKLENSLIITSDALSVGGIIAGVPQGIASTTNINVEDCSSEVIITDNNSAVSAVTAGGLVGSGYTRIASRNITINVSDSSFSGILDFKTEGIESVAGGIIGKGAKNGTISGCDNSGKLSAYTAGGISADTRDDAVIENCYNVGEITAAGYAGGIIGDTEALTTVKYCYNAGEISGTSGSGAIVGNNTSDAQENYIKNLYLADSSLYAYKIGEESFSDVEAKAMSKPEAELKSAAALNILNAEANNYVLPQDDYNNGYPVIKNVYYKTLYEGKFSVSNPVITGEIGLGNKLVLSYEADGDSNALKLVTWQWQICDTENGSYTALDETGKELEITLDTYNKYIKAVLTLPTGEKLETTPVLVSNQDFEGTVSNLKIRGIMRAGNTLTFSYESENVTDAHIISCKWERAAAADGTYTTVGTEKSYVTDTATTTNYYRVSVALVNGNEYVSDPVAVEGRGQFSYNNASHHEELKGMRVESDADYMFTVVENGTRYEFLLLDAEPDSDDGRFLVYANQTYGTAYPYSKMNDEGFKSLLPDAITRHIDYTAYHEGSVSAYGIYGQVLYGIGAISVAELLKYKDIIGMGVYNVEDINKKNYVLFGTRTNSHRTDSAGYVVSMKVLPDGSISVYDRDYQCDNHLNEKITSVCTNCIRSDAFGHANSYGTELRPIFYIDKDFFADEDIDLLSLGRKAAEIIGANSSKEDMLVKYNRKTLENVFAFSPDFVITSAVCKDMSDNEMAGISAGEFKIAADITSKCNEDNARVIAAIYDENGILEAVSSATFECEYNQSTTVEIPFSGIDCNKTLSVRISVLGTDDNLLSVTDVKELF